MQIDLALQQLNAWWHDRSPEAPPVACLSSPSPGVRASVFGTFANAVVSGQAQVLQVKAPVPPEVIRSLDTLLDDLDDSAPAPVPRIVVFYDLEELLQEKGARRRVLDILKDFEALVNGNCRVVIGAAGKPEQLADKDYLLLEINYVQPRPALLDRITRWVTDPGAPGLMLVSGPPGSGKTFLLKDAARVIDALSSVRVAYASIRDWTKGAPVAILISDLLNGLSAAFEAEELNLLELAYGGLPTHAPRPLRIEQDIKNNRGTVIGSNFSLADPAGTYIEAFITALSARAIRGQAQETLVLVIDALDEWMTFGVAALPALRDLLSRQADFAAWNFKVLLSGQFMPDDIGAPEVLDLADVNADSDLQEFAIMRLGATSVPEAERMTLANQIVRLSAGLFLIASGYLDEIEEEQLTSADLASAPAPGSAIRYYLDALERIRKRYLDREQEDHWRQAERFLSMLAVLPQGRATAEMADMWHHFDVPNTGNFRDVCYWIFRSPLRRYLTSQSDEDWYLLVHPAMRNAVAALTPWDERTGIAAERSRWIQLRTPLDGGGARWDPGGDRVAIAEVGTVLADTLVAATEGGVADQPSREQARAWAKRLLESWDWLEQCVLGADPVAKVPLGLLQLLHQIELLMNADSELAGIELWDGPEQAEALPPMPEKPNYAKPKAPPKRRTVARASDRFIGSVLRGNAYFKTRAKAAARLRVFADQYIISRETSNLEEHDQLILFIMDYSLTPAERLEGVKGHYVKMRVERGRADWAIIAEPYESSGGDPLPPRPKNNQPNWSDPFLRRVRGNPKEYAKTPKVYASVEDAEEDMKRFMRRANKAQMLHGKMRAYVYDKHGPHNPATGQSLAITQIELVTVPADGGFEVQVNILGYTGNGGSMSRAEYLELEQEKLEQGKAE
jgi:AAA ATPase-like protein